MGQLPLDHFTVAVIDEAGQALEVACWGALLQAPRCILAGDHLQLPPTIVSEKAARAGLANTLLERAVDVIGQQFVCLLNTQYRMHNLIMQWSSLHLYKGLLVAADSVKEHRLCDLPGVVSDHNTTAPVIFIDTASCGFEENHTDEHGSRSNLGEVELICLHIKELVASGVFPALIGVITPYNLQVEHLRSSIGTQWPDIEIKSVDGFQGREKEVILISLVRSNVRRAVGFLSDYRRINVALTRARRHLLIVGYMHIYISLSIYNYNYNFKYVVCCTPIGFIVNE